MTQPSLTNSHTQRRDTALWLAGALAVILFAAVLSDGSKSFGYDRDVIEMPVTDLVALLVGAGVLFFAAFLWAAHKRSSQPTDIVRNTPQQLFLIMAVAGIAARLVLFTSTPALEDDYQRYLWDGAVTAQGLNPYAVAPAAVWDRPESGPLRRLQQQSGPILERVNHAHLKTIYPPVAQAAFALAYTLQPFSLTAWRTVLMLADVTTLALLTVLLAAIGRSPLWASLYWWNPVVLKEIFNSAHMDALIFPFLLAGLLLALRSRPLLATTSLVVAAGVKLWPLLLMPLIWRRSVTSAPTLIAALVITVGLMGLWMSPLLLPGVASDSGLVAYASNWVLNSPLYKSLVAAIASILSAVDASPALTPSLLARLLIGTGVAALALAVAYPNQHDARTFLLRALIIVAALVFLSPAIYPWYTVWLLPLLVLVPQRGPLLLTVTIPLYYCYFHFAARETTAIFHDTVVWAIWLPVWGLTLYDIYRARASIEQNQHPLDLPGTEPQGLQHKDG